MLRTFLIKEHLLNVVVIERVHNLISMNKMQVVINYGPQVGGFLATCGCRTVCHQVGDGGGRGSGGGDNGDNSGGLVHAVVW